MHKVSYVLAERLSQDSLETYFGKQHPSGACKDNLPLYITLVMTTLFVRKQNVFKPTATGNVRDENINFETDTESVQCRKYRNKTILAIVKSFEQPSDT